MVYIWMECVLVFSLVYGVREVRLVVILVEDEVEVFDINGLKRI